jgi:hypothetical protein
MNLWISSMSNGKIVDQRIAAEHCLMSILPINQGVCVRQELVLSNSCCNNREAMDLNGKKFYALRPTGFEHGPFGIELGCTLLEITWYGRSGIYRNAATVFNA